MSFGLLASQVMKEGTRAILSHQDCGNLLWQHGKTNTETLTTLKSATGYFVKCPLVWVCLMIILRLWIWGKNTRLVKDVSYQRVRDTNMSSDIDHGRLVKAVSVKFLPVK